MKTIVQPIVLSRKDLDDLDPPVVYDECDCACPDNGFSFDWTIAKNVGLLQWPKLHLDMLPNGNSLLFNPLDNHGVVVLNQLAFGLWKLFELPRSVKEIQDSFNFNIKQSVDRMLSLGVLESANSTLKVLKSSPKTLSVWLHVTNECNLRCDYCYINKTSDEMNLEVGYAAVDAVIRSALHNHFKRIKIKFAGGEATLNLKLVYTLDEYARQKTSEVGIGYESVVLSNGVVLGENDIEELLERKIRLMISLDGVGQSHDRQRKFINGRGSFAWVNRTLDRVLKFGLNPFISITVTDRNAESLAETVSFVLDKDLPFNVNFFRDNECTSNFNDLHLLDDKIIASMKEAFGIIEKRLPSFSLMGALVDRSSFGQAHEKTCGVGESYMVIDHKGHVAKCHMEIEKPVTNIHAEDPLAFIRADSLGVQNLSVEEKEGCRDCEWRYWCAGGCPLLTFKATGRYDVKSPYCRVYKAIYPELLRLEGLRLLKYANDPTAVAVH